MRHLPLLAAAGLVFLLSQVCPAGINAKGSAHENDGYGNYAATGRRAGGAITQARLDVLGTGKAGHGQGIRLRDSSIGARLQEASQPSRLSLRQSSTSRPAMSVQARVMANAATKDRLFAAIVAVESGGNPNAVGDNGRARGLGQCWRGAWLDGCAVLQVAWPYVTGVKDYAKSRAVFYAYTSRYGAVTPEQRARCWNSGPAWRSKYSKTNKYWAKVHKAMKG